MASISDLAAAAIASSAEAGTSAQGSTQSTQDKPVERDTEEGTTEGEGKGDEEGKGKTEGEGEGEGKRDQEGQGHAARGAFIVLEGVDRSGKTTQVKMLEQRFVEEGVRVKMMRFPDRSTPIGQMIDGYLKSSVDMEDHAIHLLFSANRWEAANHIRSLLASGTTVICDRFYHSGIVYSAAKRNPSLGLSWARAPDTGLPRPDLVLFLDLGAEQARARGGWGAEKYERDEMQRTVRELFWALSMGGRDIAGQGLVGELGGLEGGAWGQDEEDIVVVDAGGGREEVAEDIWGKVRARVERVERGEMGWVVRTAL